MFSLLYDNIHTIIMLLFCRICHGAHRNPLMSCAPRHDVLLSFNSMNCCYTPAGNNIYVLWASYSMRPGISMYEFFSSIGCTLSPTLADETSCRCVLDAQFAVTIFRIPVPYLHGREGRNRSWHAEAMTCAIPAHASWIFASVLREDVFGKFLVHRRVGGGRITIVRCHEEEPAYPMTI